MCRQLAEPFLGVDKWEGKGKYERPAFNALSIHFPQLGAISCHAFPIFLLKEFFDVIFFSCSSLSSLKGLPKYQGIPLIQHSKIHHQ